MKWEVVTVPGCPISRVLCEKWVSRRRSHHRWIMAYTLANCRLTLTPVPRNHGKLHPKGAQDRTDSLKARMRARTKGLVQTFPAQS